MEYDDHVQHMETLGQPCHCTRNTLEAQHFYSFHLLSISIHEFCSLSVSSTCPLIAAEVHAFPISIPALKPYLAIPFPPSVTQPSLRPQLDLHIQRILLPHHENFLLLPSVTLVHLFKVELPEQVGENESHFQVREIAAEAVPRPDGEGVEGGTGRA